MSHEQSERRESVVTVRTFLSVAGLILVVVMAVFGYVTNRIEATEGRLETIAGETSSARERLSPLETRASAVEKRLDTIDSKLDRILERLR